MGSEAQASQGDDAHGDQDCLATSSFDHADEAEQLCGDRSSGAITALAVVTFRQLDQEIRRKSAGKLSLDNVVAELANSHSRVSLDSLQEIVSDLLQEASVTLHVDKLPGCQQIQADAEA